MNTKSHITAKGRKTPSAPCKYLYDNGYLDNGTILDYGCGRGKDAEFLECDKYDPYYFPVDITNKYDIILCTYVLNVIDPIEQEKVIDRIKSFLTSKAYITVRRDYKEDYVSSKGTYQYVVRLPYTVIYKNNSFIIYELDINK